MKKNTIITVTTILIIVFTAFSFTDHNGIKSAISNSCQTQIDTNKKEIGFAYFDLNTNQEVYYYVRGRYFHPVFKEKLKDLELVGQLFINYPYNWISDYVSIEITTNTNGIELKETSPDNRLSKKQISLIESVKIGDNIFLTVKYKTKNSATNELEVRQLNIEFTVIPEVEAEYVGGHEKMIHYLKESSKESVSEMYLWANNLQLTLFFSVNEKGNITNIELEKTSGFKELDNLVIDLVSKMPKWKPAKNANGTPVSQNFELNLRNMGC